MTYFQGEEGTSEFSTERLVLGFLLVHSDVGYHTLSSYHFFMISNLNSVVGSLETKIYFCCIVFAFVFST